MLHTLGRSPMTVTVFILTFVFSAQTALIIPVSYYLTRQNSAPIAAAL